MARVVVKHDAAARVVVKRQAAAQLLRALPARSVSLFLTDPPHQSVDRHGGGHLTKWFRGSLSWSEIARLFGTARRRLRPDGLAMVVVNGDGLPHAQAALRRAGFSHQRVIVWDQQRPGLGMGLRHQVAYVVVGLQNSSRPLSGRDLISAASVSPAVKDRYPTEKPTQLGRELAAIAGIGRGDVVIDPFCGSGNLLVGALERGATAIASDTSAKAVRLARARLSAAGAKRGRPLLDSSQISGTRMLPKRPTAKKAVRRPTAGRPGARGSRR